MPAIKEHVMSPANTLPVLRLVALLMLTVGVGSARAVTFTVGADPACTHANIQSAFSAIPAGDDHIVRIANNLVYNAQALDLVGKHVTVIGGVDDCSDATPSGVTRLSGAGGGNDSVLTLTGSGNDVNLEHLSIVDGDEVHDGFGGGIDFRGEGFLTLRDTSVSQNYAGYGGGINVAAMGGSAELRIESGTVIFFNNAQFTGGGVRLWGDARMVMRDDNTQIFDNEAIGIDPQTGLALHGFGGGIAVVKNAEAEIGSPGMSGYGVIYNNRARHGGGIAVVGEGASNEWAVARLFSTDPARPVRIQNNTASESGGGIYVKPGRHAFTGFSFATLCAWDFRIDGNAAQEGAAIHADLVTDSAGSIVGGDVVLNLDTPDVLCGDPPAGSLSCAAGTRCNVIDANFTRDVNGQPTPGATVLAQGGGFLAANRVHWRGNHGAQALHVSHEGFNGYEGSVRNCVLAENVAGGPLLLADEGADLQVDHCTIANNTIVAGHVIEAAEDLVLRRSIIDQPDNASATVGGTLDAEHVLATEIASLGGGASLVQDRPRFVDPATGDYRQLAASRGVDFAPPDPAILLDFDRAPRAVDLGVVPDFNGIADLGAFERQTSQPLVRNGDFAHDLSMWYVLYGTWNGAEGGSAEVSKSPAIADERVYAMAHCLHVPGPGIYKLDARGRAASGPGGDRVLMQWHYRRDGGPGCADSGIDAQGDLVITDSGQWTQSPAAYIDVPASEWNRNTSIGIVLTVDNSGGADPDVAHGFFDDIRLEVVDSLPEEVVFTNGFDPS
jgi:hypothetical protein